MIAHTRAIKHEENLFDFYIAKILLTVKSIMYVPKTQYELV